MLSFVDGKQLEAGMDDFEATTAAAYDVALIVFCLLSSSTVTTTTVIDGRTYNPSWQGRTDGRTDGDGSNDTINYSASRRTVSQLIIWFPATLTD
jgi:hypothetical protein